MTIMISLFYLTECPILILLVLSIEPLYVHLQEFLHFTKSVTEAGLSACTHWVRGGGSCAEANVPNSSHTDLT